MKQLVELHGGTVRAKSPGAGKGATFIVELPLMLLHDTPGSSPDERVHPAAPSASEEKACESPNLAGLRVLVVDDEPDARDLVKRTLEKCDAIVSTAASAAEALADIAKGTSDVLVSDIGMPSTDGYDFIRRIEQCPPMKAAKVPAIRADCVLLGPKTECGR